MKDSLYMVFFTILAVAVLLAFTFAMLIANQQIRETMQTTPPQKTQAK